MAVIKTNRSWIAILVSATYQTLYGTKNISGWGKSVAQIETTDHFSDCVESINDWTPDYGTVTVSGKYDDANTVLQLIEDAAATSDAVGGVKTWKVGLANGTVWVFKGHILSFDYSDLPQSGAIVEYTYQIKVTSKPTKVS